MDIIDPLRPKTVPLSAETILWFEFLLDPELLTSHLNKCSPNPPPIELIEKFLTIFPDNPGESAVTPQGSDKETPKSIEEILGRKQIALKILTLKVASHLKWNLDVIETLNLQKQIQLLDDLCTVTSGTLVSLPLTSDEVKIGPQGSRGAFEFALLVYHRWTLRVYKIFKEALLKNKANFGLNPAGTTTDPISLRDEMFATAMDPIPQDSINYLLNICQNPEAIAVLTYDSLIPLNATSEYTSQNFRFIKFISKCEIKTQIHFDLCKFFLYVNSNALARQHAIDCRDNLRVLKLEYESRGEKPADFLLCHVPEEELEGCLLACGVSDVKHGLLQRMNEEIVHQRYSNILEILERDNIELEIPFVHRKILELDIEEALKTGEANVTKDIEISIIALNTIRCLVDEENCFQTTDFMQKYNGSAENLSVLLQATAKFLASECPQRSRDRMAQYYRSLLVKVDIVKEVRSLNLLTEDELAFQAGSRFVFPQISTQADWRVPDLSHHRLEVGQLKRQLINSNASDVRKLCRKLGSMKEYDEGRRRPRELWEINASWSIPIPLQSVLKSLQRGFLKDFAYIALGKARELTNRKDFTGAVAMLTVLKTETQRSEIANTAAVTKMGKLIAWEILLVQICQCLNDWPKKHPDSASIGAKCKQCILSLQNGDAAIPRTEILEYSIAMLLNLSDWASLILPDKRSPILEVSSALAGAALDIEKGKPSKICREAWDLVLPMFLTSGGKRSVSRDSPTLAANNFSAFFGKLREPFIVSIILSLLAKVVNIIKDDTNVEISCDYMFLWPATISNSNSYNLRAVSEALSHLLDQNLKFYPQNISWLKLRADLDYLNGDNEAAIKGYVNALISGTEYCTLHLQKPLIDDAVVRRMIKCSTNLGCHMQATVLCQFLDDVDYGLAFKCISEKSASFTDAIDTYYSCIWDVTILEFIINLHAKKNEHTRKLQVISYMSQLELNANNNEEIKREAANNRKMKFLRALAKQYMLQEM
ncbi:integrator complex subunit 8 [Phlebotomus argentipes]|uniref:integrator complex subunit 8 n=1 Tax=Phlebotomus argentipes TaxID=94469 RepID=UPI0028929A8C|nr:integrator complex subunit 8 [Phlebotomus argentipes]